MAILDVRSLDRRHLVRKTVAWHLQPEPTITAFDSCQTPLSSRGNTEGRKEFLGGFPSARSDQIRQLDDVLGKAVGNLARLARRRGPPT